MVCFFGGMSDETFWNKFYADRRTNEHFDWFLRFEDVKEHLEPYLPPESDGGVIRILDIGCGTSAFSIKLFEHLNKMCRIDCIDFSDKAIKSMEAKLKKRGFLIDEMFGSPLTLAAHANPRNSAGLACRVADARALPFKDETFSLVIDKGTSDAILKGANGEHEFLKALVESLRVLAPNGRLVQFSDEPPELRLILLEKVKSNCLLMSRSRLRFIWRDLDTRAGFEHFMYIVQKDKLPH